MNIFVDKTSGSFAKQKNPTPSEAWKKRRDRRKKRLDRRQSVREGIIVTLSSKNDRRTGNDRRGL